MCFITISAEYCASVSLVSVSALHVRADDLVRPILVRHLVRDDISRPVDLRSDRWCWR